MFNINIVGLWACPKFADCGFYKGAFRTVDMDPPKNCDGITPSCPIHNVKCEYRLARMARHAYAVVSVYDEGGGDVDRIVESIHHPTRAEAEERAAEVRRWRAAEERVPDRIVVVEAL